MAKSSSNQPNQKPFYPPAGASAPGSRRNSALYAVIILLLLVVAAVVVFYILSQDKKDSSTGETNLTATPLATDVPPTEVPQEVEFQQQMRDWALTVDGVTQVLTLDVDVPGDEPPLIYAELEVGPGYNNTSIPNQLITKVSEMLNTTQYSDVVVILNDGTQITEYALDLESSSWTETLLTNGSSDSSQSN